jgi:hypothetical protein
VHDRASRSFIHSYARILPSNKLKEEEFWTIKEEVTKSKIFLIIDELLKERKNSKAIKLTIAKIQ